MDTSTQAPCTHIEARDRIRDIRERADGRDLSAAELSEIDSLMVYLDRCLEEFLTLPASGPDLRLLRSIREVLVYRGELPDTDIEDARPNWGL